MKRALLILLALILFYRISYSQNTLYDGWMSLTSSYLGNNEYEYSYQWGASTALSQDEINNLFPYDYGDYTRTSAGMGTQDGLFNLYWCNPVDILWMSTLGTNFATYPIGRTGLEQDDVASYWYNRYMWNTQKTFSFRTKGYTGTQDIGLLIKYFGSYILKPGYNDRPVLAVTGTEYLRVTGTFEPIPEPATLILLGAGLLSFAGVLRLRRKLSGLFYP